LTNLAGVTWFARNLGHALPGSWCLRDDPGECARNGRLYPWELAIRACPAGSHLATEEEWQRLEAHLGMAPAELEATRGRGAGIGDALKEGGASGLDIPLAGWRDPEGEYHVGNGNDRAAALWTATEAEAGTAWHRDVSSARSVVWRSGVDKPYALSVRCALDAPDPGAAGAGGAPARARGPYDLEFRQLSEGLWVAYRPDPLRSYVEGNVTILVNDEDVVVVDAGGAPLSARQVITHIRKLTPRPVRYVVLTHIHRDHRFGLQEYVREFPGVEVIAHPIVRDVIARSGATFVADTIARLEARRGEMTAEIERLAGEGGPDAEAVIASLRRYRDEDLPVMLAQYEGLANLGPTATFSDGLTLHRGRRTIRILFLGRGDTDHDVVVHLPEEKVVCTGDMVVHPFPYGFSKQPREWLTTLGKLAELEFDVLVPGHGDVQRGKGYLRSVIALIESVQEQVAAGIAAGKDLEAVRRSVDLSRFEAAMAGDDPVKRYFFHDYFVEGAVEEAYRTLSAPAAER
jgi:uncharacterized protein (TIGR02145 family)